MVAILEISKLPSHVVLEPPLTDEEFEELCAANDLVKLERTKEGKIVVNPPTGFDSGSGNIEINYQLMCWWKQHQRGRVLDNNTGFFLPDGSSYSPDGGYVTAEQLSRLTREARRHFPYLTPAFVIELLSASDSLSKAKEKMEIWIANGAQLAWLVDPYRRSVLVYEASGEAGKQHRIETGARLAGTGPIDGFVLDLEAVWSCYDPPDE